MIREEEEEEARDKVVGNGGATTGAMSGSGVARREFTQSKRFASSSGFRVAAQREETRGKRKMEVTSLAPDLTKESRRIEPVRLQPADALSDEDGHSTETEEPGFIPRVQLPLLTGLWEPSELLRSRLVALRKGRRTSVSRLGGSGLY
jgi:hypothetical protein